MQRVRMVRHALSAPPSAPGTARVRSAVAETRARNAPHLPRRAKKETKGSKVQPGRRAPPTALWASRVPKAEKALPARTAKTEPQARPGQRAQPAPRAQQVLSAKAARPGQPARPVPQAPPEVQRAPQAPPARAEG